MSATRRLDLMTLVFLVVIVAMATAVTALADLSDGLIAEFRFEGDATDSSGNANHGTPHGEPVYTTGHSGQAVSLDGLNDFITLPGDLWTADFTTAFWVRTTAIAPGGTQWYQGLGMVDGEVCASPPGGDFGIAMINGGYVITANVTGQREINNGIFHSVIVTRSVVDTLKVYIDGQLDVAYDLDFPGFTGMPWIGVGNNPCDANFNRLWFPGEIDELRFYDRVLDAEEITQLSESGTVDVRHESPVRPELASAFPNPFNPLTTISYAIPKAGLTRLQVFDFRGRLVATLVNESLPAGDYEIVWTGVDDDGLRVSAGIYFYRMTAGDFIKTNKMALIK